MLKNLSNRVSAKTIEETYTENDVERELVPNDKGVVIDDISKSYNPTTGFVFDYPMRWLNDRSEFKAIGIRRLNVVPSSHVFALEITINWKITISGEEKKYHITIKLNESIIKTNNIEEIMHNMINAINTKLAAISLYWKDDSGQQPSTEMLGDYLSMYYNFDHRTGDLSIGLSKSSSIDEAYFAFTSSSTITTEYYRTLVAFLEFLNQEIPQNMDVLTSFETTKSFKGVWDRDTLQFHASFSDNRRGFIGMNGDFYDNPSVFYDPPSNASNFWIKFTTDGIHEIIPRYCRFYIGLCFVRNYKNSLVTK